MKHFQTKSKGMLKNIVVISYGVIILNFFKKPIKFIRKKTHLGISIMYL